MQTIQLPTSVDLRDRTLWFDGDSSLSSSTISSYLLKLNNFDWKKTYVNEIDDDAKMFNKLTNMELTIKEDLSSLNNDYTIPDRYKSINLKKHVFNLLDIETQKRKYDTHAIEKRIKRVTNELYQIKLLNMEMLFKTIIFLIDFMIEHNVLWGVGRGSSCASYVLYLMDLHKVDAVKYNIDYFDFFRKN